MTSICGYKKNPAAAYGNYDAYLKIVDLRINDLLKTYFELSEGQFAQHHVKGKKVQRILIYSPIRIEVWTQEGCYPCVFARIEPFFHHAQFISYLKEAYFVVTQLSDGNYSLNTGIKGLGGGTAESKGVKGRSKKKAKKLYEVLSQEYYYLFSKESLDNARKLIKNGAGFYYEGKSLLNLAIEKSCPDIAKVMLEHGAPIDPPSDEKDDEYALILAINKGFNQLLELLIDHGADPKYPFALHSALWESNFSAAKLLIKNGADIRSKMWAKDFSGIYSPMGIAIILKSQPFIN